MKRTRLIRVSAKSHENLKMRKRKLEEALGKKVTMGKFVEIVSMKPIFMEEFSVRKLISRRKK